MTPLDRIHQLTDENAILRSQLHDAQEQAKRDTETIGRLAHVLDDLQSSHPGGPEWTAAHQELKALENTHS